MGRTPCCDKVGLKKGPWTPEEDQKLLAYIEEHGHGSWRALPSKAGLQRCGKSCRLRWTNYLRPDIKRGKFSLQEEQTIIQLHALLGNRWSAIATHLAKRTDNEIKNYWNTHLKKKLTKMGIDPLTHKPKNEALLSSDGPSKNAANLSHMAQWESARLEAEARLVRQSKLRSNSLKLQPQLGLAQPEFTSASISMNKSAAAQRCLDILNAWNGGGGGEDLESPKSTMSFSENAPPIKTAGVGESSAPAEFIEFVGNSGSQFMNEGEEDWKGLGNSMSYTSEIHDVAVEGGAWSPESLRTSGNESVNGTGNFVETFTDLLLSNSGDRSFFEGGGESDSGGGGGGGGENCSGGSGSDYYEDNKNYWNSILDLVNSPPSHF